MWVLSLSLAKQPFRTDFLAEVHPMFLPTAHFNGRVRLPSRSQGQKLLTSGHAVPKLAVRVVGVVGHMRGLRSCKSLRITEFVPAKVQASLLFLTAPVCFT